MQRRLFSRHEASTTNKKTPSHQKTIIRWLHLIEALVAGLVVAAVMTAVGRLSVSAMATSKNQSTRNQIEAAINDHIQLLQMQDSYLTQEAITSPEGLNTTMDAACQARSISEKPSHAIQYRRGNRQQSSQHGLG